MDFRPKKCKRDSCNELAVTYAVKTEGFKRKQYCAEHYQEYKDKQKAAQVRYQARPHCEKSVHNPHCTNRASEDEPYCVDCRKAEAEYEEQASLNREWNQIETVEELKVFLYFNVPELKEILS